MGVAGIEQVVGEIGGKVWANFYFMVAYFIPRRRCPSYSVLAGRILGRFYFSGCPLLVSLRPRKYGVQ